MEQKRTYTQFDLFRYAKFIQENDLKNNIHAIDKFNGKYHELTEEQKTKNLLKAIFED